MHHKAHSCTGGVFPQIPPHNKIDQYDWVINPFHTTAPVGFGFSTGEEDPFNEMTADSAITLQFSRQEAP